MNHTVRWLEHLDGSRVRILDQGVVLGQGEGCTFRVFDTRVLGRHARIDIGASEAFLAPCSDVPCQHNGEVLAHPRVLQNGDWVSLLPGQLFRYTETQHPMGVWQVRLRSKRHVLGYQESLSGHWGTVRHSDCGRLLLSPRLSVGYQGRQLPCDGRSWSLATGDVLTLPDGMLQVIRGPSGTPWSRPWSAQGRLRQKAPHRVTLQHGDSLMLFYTDGCIEVPVRAAASLAHALVVAQGQGVSIQHYGGAHVLRELRESLITCGVDGFTVVPCTDGQAQLPVADSSASTVMIPQLVQAEQVVWWLCRDDGSCWRIGHRGILLGRHEACDVRLSEPYVHRYHALLLLQDGAPVLSPLGRHPTYLNGVSVTEPVPVSPKVDIRIIPEQRLWVEQRPAPVLLALPYTLVLPSGASVNVSQEVATIGPTTRADITVPGWGAPCALIRTAHALYVHSSTDSAGELRVGGDTILPRHSHALQAGSVLVSQSVAVRLSWLAPPEQPVMLRQVTTHAFARVGRLRVRLSDDSVRELFLPESLFTVLQILLESAVGRQLRGIIQTHPGLEPADNDVDVPDGAMRLHDLRHELSSSRRLSITATRQLLAELSYTLVQGGLDGPSLVQVGPWWARLMIPSSCTVDLYR